MEKYRTILEKYLPGPAVPRILQRLSASNVQLNITRSRTTKLGDYRSPHKVNYHKISINHDLNKYQFLLTLVHELAHLETFEKYKNRVRPHGKEWKASFRELMEPFLNESVFPPELLAPVRNYLENPSSSTSNTALLTEMRKHDGPKDYHTLEELPMDSLFRIHNGVVFKKVEKLRKRYKCLRMDNRRIYVVSPLMKVVPVDQQN
jgi:hypothetical protein